MLERRVRSGRTKFTTVIFLLAAWAGVWIGYLFLDVWWAAEQMKTVARMTITDWEITHNKTSTQEYLLYQMTEYEIPNYIPDDACTLTDTRQDGRQIYCHWETFVVIPIIKHEVPRYYEFTTTISEKGTPVQW